MLQSKINDMFSIKKELNIEIPVSVCSVPKGYGEVKSITIDAFKNPAYKSINSSQIIISKEIKIEK